MCSFIVQRNVQDVNLVTKGANFDELHFLDGIKPKATFSQALSPGVKGVRPARLQIQLADLQA